jgi:hypothetical protein
MKNSAYVIEIEQAEKETGRTMLNTRHKIATQITQITQLTNNWNELRKRIKEYLEECENSDDEWLDGKCDMARDILYDMEEIKEKNNV